MNETPTEFSSLSEVQVRELLHFMETSPVDSISTLPYQNRIRIILRRERGTFQEYATRILSSTDFKEFMAEIEERFGERIKSEKLIIRLNHET